MTKAKRQSWTAFLRNNCLRLGMCGVTVLLLLVLLATGMVGSVNESMMSTHYRFEVGAPEPRSRIVAGGVVLAYMDTGGTGPAIICLHAIGHGARDFEDLARRLRSRYRIIALDFPGQGYSGPDTVPASGTRYTELLAEFIRKLDLHSVTLIGNSIGGAVAVRYASLHPENVHALVLCDAGGLGPPGAIGRFFIGVFVQFFAAGRRGAFWFPFAFSRYYAKVLPAERAHEERTRIVRSAFEIAPVLEQAWRSFARPEENLLPVLAQVSCPVFLAWARDDFVLPLKSSRPNFELFRNHRLEVFAGGHAAFLEAPDRFEQSLRTFLETVSINRP